MYAEQLRAASVQPAICFNKYVSRCRIQSVAALGHWLLRFLDRDVPGYRALGLWGNMLGFCS